MTPGAATDALLDWWGERLETDCVVAPERGYFVDQRWMDFAPGLVPELRTCCATPATTSPTGTCRARKVAPRRRALHGQRRGRCASSTTAASTRERRDQLSKHQDRIRPRPTSPRCASSAGATADRLLAAGLRAGAATGRYTYDALARRHAARRRGARLAPARRSRRASWTRSPFTAEGAHELIAWLNQPAEVGGDGRDHAATWSALHAGRPDLQRGFPDLDGDGRRALRRRGRTSFGRATIPIPDALRARATGGADGDAAPPAGRQRRGLLPLGAGRRRGRAARSSPRWRRPGVAVAPVGLNAERQQQDATLGPAPAASRSSRCNLICVNADVLPRVRRPGRPRASSRAATRSGCGGGRSRRSPSAGMRRLRPRRRGLGRQPHVADALARGLAGARGARSRSPWPVPEPAGARPRGAGAARGLPVPVLVRLQQRLRAQEPAGGDRGVHARLPEPGRAGRSS